MDLASLKTFISSLWVVWMTVLFLGIITWVYWPRNRTRLNDAALIPFRDDRE